MAAREFKVGDKVRYKPSNLSGVILEIGTYAEMYAVSGKNAEKMSGMRIRWKDGRTGFVSHLRVPEVLEHA